MDLEEVTLIGILYTDGCLSPKGKNSWRLYLGNTSWQIIKLFKVSLMKVFDLPESRIRISCKSVNNKPFYKAVVDSKEIGQYLTKKYGTFRTLKYSTNTGSGIYPAAHLPNLLSEDESTICHFLKIAFSCDGGINLYVASNKYVWLIRNVYLACQHPVLIKQYNLLLRKIGIIGKILNKDEMIRIQGRSSLERFLEKIGFVKGVKVTQNSAYWCGIEKQKVLELAVSSYDNPRLIINLPQFKVKI